MPVITGSFPSYRAGPPLDLLSRFAAAFFALEVAVLPAAPVTGVTMRINRHAGQRQLLTRDLLADQRPAGACCVVGITMDDLYPDPAWNFAFGQASPRDRAGVYSFARYLPGEAGAARLPAAAPVMQGAGARDRPSARHRPLRVLLVPDERLGPPRRERRPAAAVLPR